MRVVTTAFRVLEEVAVHQPVGVSELARILDVPKSTVQRALQALWCARTTRWGWSRRCTPRAPGKPFWPGASPGPRRRARARLEGFTTRTLVDVDALHRELRAIREAGYSINRREWRDDIRGVAAVRDADGRARAAISVAVPTHRLPDEDIPALGELVSRIVGQLNAAVPDAVLGA